MGGRRIEVLGLLNLWRVVSKTGIIQSICFVPTVLSLARMIQTPGGDIM